MTRVLGARQRQDATAADLLGEALRLLNLAEGDWIITVAATDGHVRDLSAVRPGERRRFRGGRLKVAAPAANGDGRGARRPPL